MPGVVVCQVQQCARVVPPTTSRLTPRNAGLLDGVKIGLPIRTRVTPGNTVGVGNTIVGNTAAVLLDRWFVCK